MNFTEVVRKKIKEKNYKITDIAHKTGYSYMYCIDLLRGRRRWNEDTIDKFCEALGIKPVFVQQEDFFDQQPPTHVHSDVG